MPSTHLGNSQSSSQPTPDSVQPTTSRPVEAHAPELAALIAPHTEAVVYPEHPGFWGSLRSITPDEFNGTVRSRTALNDGLRRAWGQDNPISWIITRVRCEILQLSPHEYAVQHGSLAQSTLLGLERFRDYHLSRYSPSTIHLLFKGWDAIAAQKQDQKTSELLVEAKQEILRLLTPEHQNSVYGMLCRWRHEVGGDTFESSTGLTYKTLWQRGKTLGPGDFSELLNFARALGFIDQSEKSPHIWQNPKMIEMQAAWLHDSALRGRSPEISKLHLLLHTAGLQVDAGALGPRTESKLQAVITRALARFETVPWNKVTRVFSMLHKHGHITQEQLLQHRELWQREYRERAHTFEDALQGVARKEGLTNAVLTDALDLRARYPLKPVLPVYRALHYGAYCGLLSAGVLAHAIVRDDALLNTLLQQKRAEIAACWKRIGSGIDSPVAVERSLWNVDYAQLPFSKNEVQKLEWGKPSSLQEAVVLAEIRRVGESHARAPLIKLLEQEQYTTVQNTIANLIYRYGIAALESKLGTSQLCLNSFQFGAEVPNLPKFTSFLAEEGIPFSNHLEMDWREQTGRHLALTHLSDIERVISAHICEHSESKRALLIQHGNHPIALARPLRQLSETSVIERKQFTKVLAALGVDPNSSRAAFMRHVAATGSIVQGLSEWLRATPERDTMREALVHAVTNSAPLSYTDSPLDELRALRRGESLPVALRDDRDICRHLPGVTISEIRLALNEQLSAEHVLHKTFLSECVSKHTSHQEILYAVGDNVASLRKPTKLLAKAIKQGVPSATIPLGIMAYLAADTMESAQHNLERARTTIRGSLEALSLPVSELGVEMRLWGIRPDETSLGKKALNGALWSGASESAAVALERVSELAADKTTKTLARLLHRKSASTPMEVVAVVKESIQGGVRAFVEKARISFSAPQAFLRGTDVPTLRQLQDLAALADIKLNALMELEWLFAYGDLQARSKHSVFTRAFSTQLATTVTAPTTQPETDTRSFLQLEERLLKALLAGTALSYPTYRRALRQAQHGAGLSQEHVSALAETLGHKKGSPSFIFLQCCARAASMTDAIVQWQKRTSNNLDLSRGFNGLVSYLTHREASQAGPASEGRTLEALLKQLTSVSTAQNIQKEVRLVARILAGATTDEVLQAAEEHRKEVEIERMRMQTKSEPKSAERLPQIASTWEITRQMALLPFEAKISLLAHRLIESRPVSMTSLFALFHERSLELRLISHTCGAETPWYIGALVCYREPEDALSVMMGQFRQGLVPRHDGPKHFKYQQKWLKERESFGKLHDFSIKLSFEEPFVMPKNLPTSRGSRTND